MKAKFKPAKSKSAKHAVIVPITNPSPPACLHHAFQAEMRSAPVDPDWDGKGNIPHVATLDMYEIANEAGLTLDNMIKLNSCQHGFPIHNCDDFEEHALAYHDQADPPSKHKH